MTYLFTFIANVKFAEFHVVRDIELLFNMSEAYLKINFSQNLDIMLNHASLFCFTDSTNALILLI